MCFSAQEIATIGIAELTSPVATSGHATARSSRTVSRPPRRTSASGRSVSAPIPSRTQTSVVGASSRTPILMNMKLAPQIAESASSMTAWRRLTWVATLRL